MVELIAFAAIMVSIFGSAKDGVSSRYKETGWLPWHLIGWLARDIPILIIAIGIYLHTKNLTWPLILILSRAGHWSYYDQAREMEPDFRTGDDPPKWWLKIRQLWG